MKQSNRLTWKDFARVCEWDGGLWEVVLPDATTSKWQATLGELKRRSITVDFSWDGVAMELPSASEIFKERRARLPRAAVMVNGVTFHTYFHHTDEIVFTVVYTSFVSIS